MTKIVNLTASPFDIETLNGPRVLPAMGSVDAEFESAYLELLISGGAVVVDHGGDEEKPKPKKPKAAK